MRNSPTIDSSCTVASRPVVELRPRFRGPRQAAAAPRPRFLAALLLSGLFSVAGAAENLVRVQFREVDTLFANPGQGWMSQQRSPRGEPQFPCSVVYIRFDWADAEPEGGNYNWKLIDDVIAAWSPAVLTLNWAWAG